MILLDTHAWIWFINEPEELGKRARTALEKARAAGEPLHVSCISTWEVYMLCARGRLKLTVDPEVWVTRCEQLDLLRFHPVNNAIMRMAVTHCAAMHADPADRMIVATALYLGASMITRDDKIRSCGLVRCIW